MVEKQGAGSVGSDGGVCGVGNSTDVCNGSLELGDGNYKKGGNSDASRLANELT